MATMLAHIRIHPGMEEAFESVAATLYEATHRHEHGVVRYEYWRGAEPGTYYTLGSFDGYDGFIRHQTSNHHVGAGPALNETIAELRIEWLDPVGGANTIKPTESSPPPPDATELELSYRSRHAVEVQPWWLAMRAGTAGAS